MKNKIVNVIFSALSIGAITTSIITIENTNNKYEELKNNYKNVTNNVENIAYKESNKTYDTIKNYEEILKELEKTIDLQKEEISKLNSNNENLLNRIVKLESEKFSIDNFNNKLNGIDNKFSNINDKINLFNSNIAITNENIEKLDTKNKVMGKWKQEESENIWEFKSDGNIYLNNKLYGKLGNNFIYRNGAIMKMDFYDINNNNLTLYQSRPTNNYGDVRYFIIILKKIN